MMDNKNIYRQTIKPVYENVNINKNAHKWRQNMKYNNRIANKNNRFRYNNQRRPITR
jgi:hypothetical protein